MRVRTESDMTISVRPLNDHDQPPRKFAPGRVCAEPGCDTRLSIYNEGTHCSKHNMSVKPRLRGKKVH